MSFAFTAAAVVVGATVYTQRKQAKAQKKAQKQAKQDALEDSLQSRRSEVFAETEGKGIGQLGKVKLDDELEDEYINTKTRARI